MEVSPEVRDPEDSLVHSWTCWARGPAVTLQGAREFGWSEAAAQTARGTRDPGSWGPAPCPLAIAAAVPSPGRPYPRATPPNSPAGSSCPLDPIPPLGWLGLGCAHWLRELRGGRGRQGGRGLAVAPDGLQSTLGPSVPAVNQELVRRVRGQGRLVVHSSMEQNVGLLRLYPGIPASLVGTPPPW